MAITAKRIKADEPMRKKASDTMRKSSGDQSINRATKTKAPDPVKIRQRINQEKARVAAPKGTSSRVTANKKK